MKPILRYSLFAVVCYVMFLLLLFPADRAYKWLQNKTNVPVQLYQISGSVWGGKISLVRIAGVDIADVEWCVHPAALLLGRVEIGLSKAGASIPMHVVVGRSWNGSFYVRQADESLSVPDLEQLFNPQPFGLTGSIDVDLADIELVGGQLKNVTGEMIWRNAGLSEFLQTDVGDLQLFITTKNDVVEIELKDSGGPLAVKGLLMLMPDYTYRLTMTLQVMDAARGDLKQALALVGTASTDGKVSMTRRGRLDPRAFLH